MISFPAFHDELEKLSSQHEDLIPGGKADNKSPSDFDQSSLKKGMKVESEHTSNKAIAKEIAMDHLTEDKKYYKKLQKMEKSAAKKEPISYSPLERGIIAMGIPGQVYSIVSAVRDWGSKGHLPHGQLATLSGPIAIAIAELVRRSRKSKEKSAGVMDFLRLLGKNPKSEDLDKAFKKYVRDTGKDLETMSYADINRYLEKVSSVHGSIRKSASMVKYTGPRRNGLEKNSGFFQQSSLI